MGEMAGQETFEGGEVTEAPPVAEEISAPETDGNPNWQPFLDVLPTSLHHTVRPVLEEWDRGVKTRFDEINQQYDPWKPFIENGVDPEGVELALSVLQQLNEDPETVYKALGEHYGYGTQQQQQVEQQNLLEPGDEGYVDPKVAELEQGFKQLASIILEERQTKEQETLQQREDSDLDEYLGTLKERHGDFNERIVLGLMLSGMSGEDAVSEYLSSVGPGPRTPAPKVLTQGGLVSQPVDTRNMPGKTTRNLVAQMLEQAAQSD